MSHRNECLISSPEEAKDWLERYRHTVTDPQVLKVLEQLETKRDGTILAYETTLDALRVEVAALEKEAKELKRRM